ncbi:MAG: hypothetical protein NVS9B8_06070 [Candidatus Limnocylindrales bacterium]
MKISRLRVAALGAAMALSIVGAGVAFAAEPTTTSGVEAATAETEAGGIEAAGSGGHADAPGVDVNHEFNGNE